MRTATIALAVSLFTCGCRSFNDRLLQAPPISDNSLHRIKLTLDGAACASGRFPSDRRAALLAELAAYGDGRGSEAGGPVYHGRLAVAPEEISFAWLSALPGALTGFSLCLVGFPFMGGDTASVTAEMVIGDRPDYGVMTLRATRKATAYTAMYWGYMGGNTGTYRVAHAKALRAALDDLRKQAKRCLPSLDSGQERRQVQWARATQEAEAARARQKRLQLAQDLGAAIRSDDYGSVLSLAREAAENGYASEVQRAKQFMDCYEISRVPAGGQLLWESKTDADPCGSCPRVQIAGVAATNTEDQVVALFESSRLGSLILSQNRSMSMDTFLYALRDQRRRCRSRTSLLVYPESRDDRVTVSAGPGLPFERDGRVVHLQSMGLVYPRDHVFGTQNAGGEDGDVSIANLSCAFLILLPETSGPIEIAGLAWLTQIGSDMSYSMKSVEMPRTKVILNGTVRLPDERWVSLRRGLWVRAGSLRLTGDRVVLGEGTEIAVRKR